MEHCLYDNKRYWAIMVTIDLLRSIDLRWIQSLNSKSVAIFLSKAVGVYLKL